MTKQKKAQLILLSIWLIAGAILLISVFAIGLRNESAQPTITVLSKIYICSIPVYGIIKAVIQREFVVFQIVLWLCFLVVALWFLIVPMIR
jgi:hypothetical protein